MNISPRQVYLAGLLHKDVFEWEDLNFEERAQIYFIDMDLDGLVEEEKLVEFERELALAGELGVGDKILSNVFSKMRVSPQMEHKVRQIKP